MHYWQFSKYTPVIDFTTQPKHPTWTSIFDIGKNINNTTLTEADYLIAESSYVNAIKEFLNEINGEYLEVALFFKSEKQMFDSNIMNYNDLYDENIIDFQKNVYDGQIVRGHEIEFAIRLSLREDISTMFRYKQRLFINITFDMYVEIGCDIESVELINRTQKLGLNIYTINSLSQENIWITENKW